MTNNTPKAIDTHYNGYKFRSRLEARWAVFFDELHIAYDYEPKGFDLNGVHYLPDFHLTKGLTLHQFEPTHNDQIWVEIKPEPELSDTDRKKIAEFVKQTDHHVLLIAGQPDINATLRFIDHHPETGWLVADVRWIELQNDRIGLVPIEYLNNAELLTQTNTPRLRYALEKARQSRFEFGQTPVPSSSFINEDIGIIPTPNQGGRGDVAQEENLAKEAPHINTKICKSCGKSFRPYRQHFIYCPSCYHQQKKQPLGSVQSQFEVVPTPRHPKPNGLIKKKRYIISLSLFLGCVFPALIFAGLILTSGWFLGYMSTGGLFGVSNSTAATATVTLPATYTPQTANTPLPDRTPAPPKTNSENDTAAVCSCTKNTYDCADFITQAEAQICFDSCYDVAGDIHFLDSNKDGRACETLP